MVYIDFCNAAVNLNELKKHTKNNTTFGLASSLPEDFMMTILNILLCTFNSRDFGASHLVGYFRPKCDWKNQVKQVELSVDIYNINIMYLVNIQ